jgi:hypothetical protein
VQGETRQSTPRTKSCPVGVKAFPATAAMQLAGQGRLAVGADVNEYRSRGAVRAERQAQRIFRADSTSVDTMSTAAHAAYMR